MNIKDIYLEDFSASKKERIRRIIDAAKEEFEENGITNSKLSVIAKKAKVGEASIYRYFADKTELVKLVAYDYWKDQTVVFDEYLDDNIDVRSNGLQKIESALGMFIELYYKHRPFLKFMEDLDTFLVPSKVTEEESDFFEYINYIKNSFINMFREGIADGSIIPDFDPVNSYSFVAQVMVSTTQKMALRLGYSHIEDDAYAVSCLNNTIQMFIKYISN